MLMVPANFIIQLMGTCIASRKKASDKNRQENILKIAAMFLNEKQHKTTTVPKQLY